MLGDSGRAMLASSVHSGPSVMVPMGLAPVGSSAAEIEYDEVAMVATAPSFDPTFYPVEDDMGEGVLQLFIRELLRPLLQRFLTERGVVAFVGSDQFIYWVQFTPTTSVAPDVYVMPGWPPDTVVDCWKTWEHGVVPSFALEVVSKDVRKDYQFAPQRYEELGVEELVIFDPEPSPARERVRWQVYRRTVGGRLELVERSDGDRIRAHTLDAWLRVVGEGSGQRLRIGEGPDGDELFPTEAEAQAARASTEAARARAEEARARAEEARVRDAEAEIARLRAELDALRKRGS